MAALTSLALGAASMAFGAYNMFAGKEEAKQGYEMQQKGAMIQADAARQAADISKEQAASSVVYAGRERDLNQLAAAQSVSANNASLAINQGIVGENKNIEEQKRQAMELDARRQQLEIIRTQQRARALSLTTGVAQGGSGYVGGSSARGGAYGQISGQTGTNLLGVQQALEGGRNIFGANANITNLNSSMAQLQNMYNNQQATNQTARADLMYGYAQANAGYQTRQADVQTIMAQGGGMTAIGGGYVNQGNSQAQMGQSFVSAGPSIFNIGMNVNTLTGGSSYFQSTPNQPFWSPSPFMKMFS